MRIDATILPTEFMSVNEAASLSRGMASPVRLAWGFHQAALPCFSALVSAINCASLVSFSLRLRAPIPFMPPSPSAPASRGSPTMHLEQDQSPARSLRRLVGARFLPRTFCFVNAGGAVSSSTGRSVTRLARGSCNIGTPCNPIPMICSASDRPLPRRSRALRHAPGGKAFCASCRSMADISRSIAAIVILPTISSACVW
jgi:hypothetical protein